MTSDRALPVFPGQRTSQDKSGWSGSCQNRKSIEPLDLSYSRYPFMKSSTYPCFISPWEKRRVSYLRQSLSERI
jgi:hypothetical protein